jgi:ribosomal protein S27E
MAFSRTWMNVSVVCGGCGHSQIVWLQAYAQSFMFVCQSCGVTQWAHMILQPPTAGRSAEVGRQSSRGFYRRSLGIAGLLMLGLLAMSWMQSTGANDSGSPTSGYTSSTQDSNGGGAGNGRRSSNPTPHEIDQCMDWESDAAYYGKNHPKGQAAVLEWVAHDCEGIY